MSCSIGRNTEFGQRMHLNERQTEILQRARARGRVEVEELAGAFEVTPQTIRADLNDLCERPARTGARRRGAGVAGREPRLCGPALIAEEEKRAIGAAAAAMIPDRCSVFVNVGTTTEEVAPALMERQELRGDHQQPQLVAILSATRATR